MSNTNEQATKAQDVKQPEAQQAQQKTLLETGHVVFRVRDHREQEND